MNNQDNKTIINCHTHVFTIDHVPNEFGKSLMPWPVYKILTIKTIKWYYTNFTSIGSTRYKSFIRKWNKFFYTLNSASRLLINRSRHCA